MNQGVAVTALAYFIWGFMPVYFKTLQGIPSFQITGQRVLWSFVFVVVLLTLTQGWRALGRAITLRRLLLYFCSGLLLLANWLVYIWGVQHGFVIESSLGYFINPLVSVVLGVVFLKEKLRPMQWIPIGMAGVGVLYLTITYGSLPWLAIALALTFGFYGLIKKLAPLGSVDGLVLETGLVLPLALAYLGYEQMNGNGLIGMLDPAGWLLIASTGVVTAVPLLLFAKGTRTVPLSLMGILFYLSPTLQFLSGVWFFGEEFTLTRQIGFSIIWLALVIYTLEGFMVRRKAFSASPS
jgi:chloramphenicol-sensitive protein RarD